MVEFALVCPIVFMMFFASIEFCRVAMIRHTADNAIYEGARRAIIPGGTAAEAHDTAVAILTTIGANSVSVVVSPNLITPTTREVTVRATVPLDNNSYLPSLFFARRTINCELTMLREGGR
jgi:Flp pilus assembly protein TadG